MNVIFRIRPNITSEVRTTLCIEDVEFSDMEVLKGFGLVTIDDSLGEEILVFKEPYRVPKFNKFYASRIKSVADPYLIEAIERLLYLNPNPNLFMVKKITEYIVMNFSAIQLEESNVLTDHQVPKPVLKFEHVETIVHALKKSSSGYEPDNEDSIMFLRNSSVSKEDKIRLRAYYRANMVKDLLERAIHTIAEHLIEAQEQIKVTDTRIEKTKMVTTKKGPASIQTIRKYMADRTKRIMKEHNLGAPFATETTEEKYYAYLTMDEESSLSEISETLDVSRSTASYFKRLRTKNELPENLIINL